MASGCSGLTISLDQMTYDASGTVTGSDHTIYHFDANWVLLSSNTTHYGAIITPSNTLEPGDIYQVTAPIPSFSLYSPPPLTVCWCGAEATSPPGSTNAYILVVTSGPSNNYAIYNFTFQTGKGCTPATLITYGNTANPPRTIDWWSPFAITFAPGGGMSLQFL